MDKIKVWDEPSIREFLIPCPKCNNPVRREVFFFSNGCVDWDMLDATCECESCGNKFLTKGAFDREVGLWSIGKLKFDAEGYDYPVIHNYPSKSLQADPFLSGTNALKFLKDHGVDEIEYFCPDCFTKHKESIDKILEERKNNPLGFSAECPNTERYNEISFDLLGSKDCLRDHQVKASTYIDCLPKDNYDDNVQGVINVFNWIRYPDKNNSVKRMNFM